eukprot:CAMPEP_0204639830 /NCGR_PEP_ID=MMETSP0717-20131115/44555_1 /ASSEMBLY_ACC=CAM_ASM_000666 /TAXON_ID=230516 /ORGANISM="Chaetoceros curvisetus" /LENGTH=57 /DNA_ID=CAMNT_0051660051 /DNA_START=9 /DNA_END=182 /DNA_ORIENTATION=+
MDRLLAIHPMNIYALRLYPKNGTLSLKKPKINLNDAGTDRMADIVDCCASVAPRNSG